MTETSSAAPTELRHKTDEMLPGWRWRILASILGPVAWLSFTLLYVGFWATGFSLFQSIIVILVSGIILGGVMGALWTSWAPRYGRRWDWDQS